MRQIKLVTLLLHISQNRNSNTSIEICVLKKKKILDRCWLFKCLPSDGNKLTAIHLLCRQAEALRVKMCISNPERIKATLSAWWNTDKWDFLSNLNDLIEERDGDKMSPEWHFSDHQKKLFTNVLPKCHFIIYVSSSRQHAKWQNEIISYRNTSQRLHGLMALVLSLSLLPVSD